MIQDLRYGIRMLLKKPGFTLVAIITLALGIGANTAIFSMVKAVLLKPLPYEAPDQLVKLSEKHKQDSDTEVAPANFIDWQEQSRSFTGLAAYALGHAALVGRDEPEQVAVASVSAEFFPLLGVRPLVGRTFLMTEDQSGADDVILLSHGLWQRRFGADPTLVGQTVMLDGESYKVIGIMPPGFQFPAQTDIWSPLALSASQRTTREAHFLEVVARLKPGVTLQQARSEMETITRRLQQQYPETNTDWQVSVVSLQEYMVGKVRSALFVLLAAVGLVLLIACANLASLLLARAIPRQKEMAVRAALGAHRFRLIRQLLTESLLLALLGGLLGLLLAAWGSDLLTVFLPEQFPRVKEIEIDRLVAGFALALSLVTGLLFGVIPALQVSKPDLNSVLKEGGRGFRAGGIRFRSYNLLVMIEVALALVLLVGAGLLMRSFVRLQEVDLGFDPHRILTMEINLSPGTYRESYQVIPFYQQLFEKIRAVPGVQSVGAIFMMPLSGENRVFSWRPAEQLDLPLDERPAANFRIATSDYFRTLGIELLRGRYFSDSDREGTTPVLLINEAMARRFWPGTDPIGRRIIVRNESTAREIIGVVGDVKHFGRDVEPGAEMYVPHLQWPARSMRVVVKTATDPTALANIIQQQVWAVDRNQPVANVQTMEQLMAASIAQRRFNLLLLGLFAAVALALAVVGIYGVISYSVMQRTHEIGIRMALGAQAREVLQLVVGQGMKLVLIGVAVGIGGALALTRLLSSLLFGVTPTDPVTFLCVSLLLGSVALLACYLPARRATKVDPMVALRYE